MSLSGWPSTDSYDVLVCIPKETVQHDAHAPPNKFFLKDTAGLEAKTSNDTRFDAIFNGRQAWPVYELPDAPADRHALTAILRRNHDGYCPDCREFRQSGRFNEALRNLRNDRKQWLWCTSCQEAHAPLLFSGAQRKTAVPETRI